MELGMGFCKGVSLDCGKVYPEKKLYKYMGLIIFSISWLYILPVSNSQAGYLQSKYVCEICVSWVSSGLHGGLIPGPGMQSYSGLHFTFSICVQKHHRFAVGSHAIALFIPP